MTDHNKTLYLVDVSSMYFRSYYAIRHLNTSKGFPTNALYGFLKMTVKLLTEIKPHLLAYCFDRKEPSFRKKIYEPYKANRIEMPEDFQVQVPYVEKITKALGIPCYDKFEFEADDVIGTLCKWGQSQGLCVVIISSDKDFAQLIDKDVTMWDPIKDVKYTPQKVFKKWGIFPHQMTDYLAICGDASDNVPGVKGIGPKGAQSLLGQYSCLEGIYQNIENLSQKKQKQDLLDGKKNAFLSKDLVTIRTDVPLNLTLKDLVQQTMHQDQLEEILSELEFKTFQKTLLGEKTSMENAKDISGQVKSDPVEYLDLKEAQSLLKSQQELWGFVMGEDVVLGINSKVFLVKPGNQALIDYLESLDLHWKGFDLKLLWRKLGFKKSQKAKWSSLLAAYVIFSEKINSWKNLYERLFKSNKGEGIANDLDALPSYLSYQKVYEIHLSLESLLQEKLKISDPKEVYQKIELPLLPILFDMERHGVLINVDMLFKQSQELEDLILEIEKQIHFEVGMDFNIASPKQLGKALFEKLGLPMIKQTKTGPSTESFVLEKLAPLHPVAKDVIEFRELSKLKSTYVDALPHLVHPDTNRVHTHFNQAVVTTGRLSSSNPNLQNIPIKTERGRRVRQAFIAPKGFYLVSADYSQMELRLLAHLSDDPGLKGAFEKDLDVHEATAKEIFPEDDAVTTGVKRWTDPTERRQIAKAVNFGLAYGQTAFGLSKVLNIPQSEAKDIIARYFDRFPKVKGYMSEIVSFAKEHGYVQTLFGRRRIIPELQARSGLQQRFGERAAINAPLQGAASDIVKKAMIQLHLEVKSPIILQVHDELVFEVSEDKLEDEISKIKEIMENVVQLNVPLKVNIQSGHNWDEAH